MLCAGFQTKRLEDTPEKSRQNPDITQILKTDRFRGEVGSTAGSPSTVRRARWANETEKGGLVRAVCFAIWRDTEHEICCRYCSQAKMRRTKFNGGMQESKTQCSAMLSRISPTQSGALLSTSPDEDEAVQMAGAGEIASEPCRPNSSTRMLTS